MKKKILIFTLFAILAFSLFSGFNVKASLDCESLEVKNATLSVDNSNGILVTISGTLVVKDGFEGDNTYAISLKKIFDQKNFLYSRVNLDVSCNFHDNEASPDLTNYNNMRRNLYYVNGIEAIVFCPNEQYTKDTLVTFSATYSAAESVSAISDCKQMVKCISYGTKKAHSDLINTAQIQVGKTTHTAKITGEISFSEAKPCIEGWYLINFKTLKDVYGIEGGLTSISFTSNYQALEQKIRITLVRYEDNCSAYFYLPHIVDQSYLSKINYQAFFGEDLGGETYQGVDSKIEIRRMEENDGTMPVFSTMSYTYTTTVDNPIKLENLISTLSVSAIDEIDGDITESIVLLGTNEYKEKVEEADVSERILGEYPITLRVTDSSNNSSAIVVSVKVVDNEPPTVEWYDEGDDIEVGYKDEPLSEIMFKDFIEITDNYSTTFTWEFVWGTYEANYNVIGRYPVTIRIADEAGNKTSHTYYVKVIDNIAPVFEGATTFTKSAHSDLTAYEIASMCISSVSDEIDGVVDYIIVDDKYTANANKVGSFTIKLQAKDSNRNKATFTITVNIEDTDTPYIFIKGDTVVVTNKAKYAPVEILEKYNEISNTTYELEEVVENFYSDFSDEAGIYACTMKVKDDEGDEKLLKLNVRVDKEIRTKDIESSTSFFRTLFDRIVTFFSNKIYKKIQAKARALFNRVR